MNKIPDSWLPFAVKPMTQEEHSAFLLSGYVKPTRSKKTLSKEDKAKNKALRAKYYANLSEEELSAHRAKSRERSAKYFTALSPEQLAIHRAKKLEADKKCRAKSKAQIAPPPEKCNKL